MKVILIAEKGDSQDEAKQFYGDVCDVAQRTGFRFLHLELGFSCDYEVKDET